MKLDKKDKKILIGGFIVGTILNFFINKEKYIEGLNKIIKVFDIYIIIKIILILVIQMGGFNGIELVLLGQVVLIYGEILARKYVKSINNVEVENTEWYAWMSDEEMIIHDSPYQEKLHFMRILKALGIFAILFIIFVMIKL